MWQHQRLVDPRVRELREQDPMLADTLAAYLDGFGDVAAVAQRLHVHPNTVRYRVRRIEKLLSTSLDDPEDRLSSHLGPAGDRARVRAPARPPPARRTARSPRRRRHPGREAGRVGQIALRVEPGDESLSVRSVFG